jgi:hypothetical protein
MKRSLASRLTHLEGAGAPYLRRIYGHPIDTSDATILAMEAGLRAAGEVRADEEVFHIAWRTVEPLSMIGRPTRDRTS